MNGLVTQSLDREGWVGRNMNYRVCIGSSQEEAIGQDA